ncbi:hypothetical protein ANO11243_050180 [Dothideomycetidae sp. 11243]|nr:hypothetical protein ANO11243_050180 [fungal sp. No.11243]
MTIEIHPATEQDAEELTPIAMAAFRNDVLNVKVEPILSESNPATSEQRAEYVKYRTERLRNRLTGTDKYWYKAVDVDTGKAVGLTGIYGPTAEQGAAADKPLPDPEANAVVEGVHAELTRCKKEFLGERQDVWYVPTMAVHPDYSGKGIATQLLAALLKHPEQAGQDVFLSATAPAAKLYRKAGFQPKETLHFLDGTYDLVFMVYSATKDTHN